jgi:hypothetical protein
MFFQEKELLAEGEAIHKMCIKRSYYKYKNSFCSLYTLSGFFYFFSPLLSITAVLQVLITVLLIKMAGFFRQGAAK